MLNISSVQDPTGENYAITESLIVFFTGEFIIVEAILTEKVY